MHKRTAVLTMFAASLATVAIAMACNSSGDSSSPAVATTETFKATLIGANERPAANPSTATGTFTGTLDLKTNTLTYTVQYAGLVAPSTLSHIHGPGDATVAVGVLVDFAKVGTVLFTPGPTSQSYSGTIVLTSATTITSTVNGDSLKKLMESGLAYVNVHSSTYPGGEIRGQVVKQ